MKEGIFWPRSKLLGQIVSLWAFLNNGYVIKTLGKKIKGREEDREGFCV